MGGRQTVCRWTLLLFSFVHVALQYEPTTVELPRFFSIDYENDQFLLNGSPFRYVSGSLHYFRVPRAYWRDRLRKLRAAGLNAVSTYVEWSQHEPSPGRFEFSGELDLQYFIRLAQEEDLLVLLRPGPYICAERDMGGLPPWLLTVKPDIYLRTNDTTYMEYVERYLNYVLTSVQVYLYGNGGPIIMVQIENEYGSYQACDSSYMTQLRDIVKSKVGDAAVLYSTDGAGLSFLRCGKIEGVYATVDFGADTNVDTAFLAQRIYEPHGPLVNSEFYTGWLTHWGEPFQSVGTETIVNTLDEILARNASVNFFMFHGGTNFGFLAGANFGDNYQPQLTSYDYDAPITEAGDPTSKYFAIREVIGRVPKGILSRSEKITSMPLSLSEGTKIQVLVENQGRINYGSLINDFKGLLSNATLGGDVLEDWIITGFPLHEISSLGVNSTYNYTFSCPAFFRGTFELPESYSEPLDTFLDPRGWGKGVAFINGFNIGRYWPILGPQVTLYVPGCHLKPYPALNELVLLELEKANSPHYTVSFVPEPILDERPPAYAAASHTSHFLVPPQLNQGPQTSVTILAV
ncbi:beta-galactosidase isoform X3 [Zootermopsis nevadensis]|uniref:beta-galactosidase isoform X3 n=1 Tax=Zootermopsis nevadensis TaxID=136037 RepID=UPI000B8E35ED|nr:beta-galactosidase isoform X3 [Zootermopsis nevadensis]